MSKLQAFADDKIDVNQNLKVVLETVGNIVRQGETSGY